MTKTTDASACGCLECRYADYKEASAMTAERDAQARRIAELERDAERYRIVRRGQHWSVVDGIGREMRAEVLDAAVDAARKVDGNG